MARGLGTFELARPDWPIGATIYQGGPEPNLRVVDHISGLDDPEQLPTLVVVEE